MEQPLTERIEQNGGRVVDIDAFEAAGGYVGARQALTTMTPEAVIELVKDANLRGRGGQGIGFARPWRRRLSNRSQVGFRPARRGCGCGTEVPGLQRR